MCSIVLDGVEQTHQMTNDLHHIEPWMRQTLLVELFSLNESMKEMDRLIPDLDRTGSFLTLQSAMRMECKFLKLRYLIESLQLTQDVHVSKQAELCSDHLYFLQQNLVVLAGYKSTSLFLKLKAVFGLSVCTSGEHAIFSDN